MKVAREVILCQTTLVAGVCMTGGWDGNGLYCSIR